MFNNQDVITLLLALRDLLAESPPPADAAAASAQHQARLLLKKYNAILENPQHESA
jgi:hypothetical protein